MLKEAYFYSAETSHAWIGCRCSTLLPSQASWLTGLNCKALLMFGVRNCVWNCGSHVTQATGGNGACGRLNMEHLRPQLPTNRNGLLVYLCGPPAMTDQLVGDLERDGLGQALRYEKWWWRMNRYDMVRLVRRCWSEAMWSETAWFNCRTPLKSLWSAIECKEASSVRTAVHHADAQPRNWSSQDEWLKRQLKLLLLEYVKSILLMLTGATLLKCAPVGMGFKTSSKISPRHEAIAGRIFDHALLGDASGKLTTRQVKSNFHHFAVSSCEVWKAGKRYSVSDTPGIFMILWGWKARSVFWFLPWHGAGLLANVVAERCCSSQPHIASLYNPFSLVTNLP